MPASPAPVGQMPQEEYDALDYEGRAFARAFVPLHLLPVKAIKDMRSLAIAGASLARHVVDDGTASEAVLRDAQRFIDLYEQP